MKNLFTGNRKQSIKPTLKNIMRHNPLKGSNLDKNFHEFFGIRDFCGNQGDKMFNGRSLANKSNAISLSKRGKVLESGFKKQKNRFFRNISSKTGLRNNKRYRLANSDSRPSSNYESIHDSMKNSSVITQKVRSKYI